MNKLFNLIWVIPVILGSAYIIVVGLETISSISYLAQINVQDFIFNVVLCMVVVEYGIKGFVYGLNELQEVTRRDSKSKRGDEE